jgi:hypothetical protein
MIQGNYHVNASPAKVHTVVKRIVSRTAAVGAGVAIDHYRPVAAVAQANSPRR